MKNKINQNIKAAVIILITSFMIVVMNMFTPAYIVALLGAVSSAGVLICLRDLGKSEDFMTTTFYFLGLGTVMTGVVLPFFWTGLPSAYGLMAGLIMSGFLNQSLKTKAFTHGELSVLSLLKYFNIVWVTLLG